MNWRRELVLICLTALAARGILKWFGDDVLMTLVGIGLAIVIGYRIRDYVKLRNARKQPASL
jgi:hypothetical protein